MNQKTELLPCPFCGTTKEWFSQKNGFNRCAECGCVCKTDYWNTRHQDKPLNESQELAEEVTEDIDNYIMNHIRQMYPQVWKCIPNSARKSIRGAIKNAWNFHVKQLPQPPRTKD